MSFLPVTSRLLIALLFIWSGFGKVVSLEDTYRYIEAAGLPLPGLALMGAIALEIGGGLWFIFGWNARLTAAILAAFTLATAIVFHRNFADQNELIHFLKNLAIAGGLTSLAASAQAGQGAKPSAQAIAVH